MDTEPTDLRSAVMRIEHYALEHSLTPREVCDLFSVGITASRILAPDLIKNPDAVSAVPKPPLAYEQGASLL